MRLLADLPPVPVRGPPPLPLVGALPNVLRFFADPVAVMLRLRREYGALAAVSDRDASLVCAFRPDYNRQVLSNAAQFTNNEGTFFRLPPGSSTARLLKGLPLINGASHRRDRRLMMPPLHRASVEGYRDEIAELSARAASRLRPDRPVDMAAEMTDLTLRVAMKCLFGLDPRDRVLELGRLATAFLEGLTSPALVLFPWDLPGTQYRAFLKASDALDRELRELIRRKRREPEGARDVLALLVRARDEEGSVLTDDELIGEANNLFLAGHETTAGALTWTIFLLAQHPRVEEELREELSGALRGGAPEVHDFARLPLLDAVVRESMRLLPPTAMLFIRHAAAPFELGGVALPAGTRLLLSPLITHRDPDLYPQPSRFLPERWRSIDPTPYEYMPFGAGPRMCIGASFAALQVRVALAVLLQRWRFDVAPGATVARKIRGVTLGAKHGLPILPRAPGSRRRPAARVRGDIHELVDLY